MTDGQVPVVRARGDRCELMAATVRHNRARGTHGVLRMADIVIGMLDAGRTPQQVGESMGMDAEEVERLADRGGMVVHGGDGAFSEAWAPDDGRGA